MVVEEFGNANLSAWQAGQSRLNAELASDSVYAQSDGAVTTVTEPAYAGAGPTMRWTSSLRSRSQQLLNSRPVSTGHRQVRCIPGLGTRDPLPGSVTSIASSSTGNGYLLANAAGAISIHGMPAFSDRRMHFRLRLR